LPHTRLLPPILASIRAACAWLRRAWGHVGHRYRHWLFNISFGVAIAIGLYVARDARIVVAAQNWALDTAMQGSAEVRAQRGGDIASQDLAFIDVDEETWRDRLWGNGEPFRAPRDGLLALIDYGIDREARYIVLDVIIEGGDDAGFAAQVEQRATRLKPDQHILFVRTLREPLNGMQNRLAPELRPSPLDDVIGRHPEQLHDVAPYFRVSRDGVLRDWQMWRVGCRRDAGTGKGRWEILPSVQLVIAALMLSDKQSDAKQRADVRAAFPWNKPGETDCIMDLASYAQPDVPASKVRPDDAPVWNWLNRSGLPHASELEEPSDATIALNNRIFFRFRYRQEPSPVLLIPALAVLKHAPHSDVAKNGVVVIGQSFEAAHDLHATPLGVMPGPMVLINSLESMLNPGLLQEPCRARRLAIEGILIAAVGGLLAYLDYVIAFIVILTLFIPLLIMLNYFLLLAGTWMDFAIPLLGMYVHKIIAELEAYGTRRREHRLARSTHAHRKGGD
jgi:CHASE2 domain